ncbi:MAG: transcription antitermination factor NusB [Lachnospiraceae bacterium]|nr:transcription antitermination factor NusB [Lachnospiraceae bacterium]
MTRSEIREHIFRLVFRLEFNEASEMPAQLQRYFSDVFRDDENDSGDLKIVSFSEDEEAYIKGKYDRIVSMLPSLDEVISGNSKGWDVGRIGKVDLAILRLAVYEILHDDDIPVGVAIDEAVELAKKYGQDESSSFVNGILASVAKSI